MPEADEDLTRVARSLPCRSPAWQRGVQANLRLGFRLSGSSCSARLRPARVRRGGTAARTRTCRPDASWPLPALRTFDPSSTHCSEVTSTGSAQPGRPPTGTAPSGHSNQEALCRTTRSWTTTSVTPGARSRCPPLRLSDLRYGRWRSRVSLRDRRTRGTTPGQARSRPSHRW